MSFFDTTPSAVFNLTPITTDENPAKPPRKPSEKKEVIGEIKKIKNPIITKLDLKYNGEDLDLDLSPQLSEALFNQFFGRK
jgi:hypothetical protein